MPRKSLASGRNTSPSTRDILLFIPNIVTYVRFFAGFLALTQIRSHPLVYILLMVASLLLDIADGYLARHFHQTSRYGAFIDVVVDNLHRTAMWFGAALLSPTNQLSDVASLLYSTGCLLIPCVEWTTFACSHASSLVTGQHWKFVEEDAPWLQRVMFRNGFRNSLGYVVMISLFGLPLVLFARTIDPVVPFPSPFSFLVPHLDWVVWVMVAGRLIGLVIEFGVIKSHISKLLTL